jgi:hypothetical protein
VRITAQDPIFCRMMVISFAEVVRLCVAPVTQHLNPQYQ